MFNSRDFIRQKPAVIEYFNRKGVSTGTIAEYCPLAGIPITVVCEFIMEEMPEHSELCQKKIGEINKFFGIKE